MQDENLEKPIQQLKSPQLLLIKEQTQHLTAENNNLSLKISQIQQDILKLKTNNQQLINQKQSLQSEAIIDHERTQQTLQYLHKVAKSSEKELKQLESNLPIEKRRALLQLRRSSELPFQIFNEYLREKLDLQSSLKTFQKQARQLTDDIDNLNQIKHDMLQQEQALSNDIARIKANIMDLHQNIESSQSQQSPIFDIIGDSGVEEGCPPPPLEEVSQWYALRDQRRQMYMKRQTKKEHRSYVGDVFKLINKFSQQFYY